MKKSILFLLFLSSCATAGTDKIKCEKINDMVDIYACDLGGSVALLSRYTVVANYPKPKPSEQPKAKQ